MIEKQLTVTNQDGIYARPAWSIHRIAIESKSEVVFFRCDDPKNIATGRKMFSLRMLGAREGTMLNCHVSGPDEVETMGKIEALFASGFNMNVKE